MRIESISIRGFGCLVDKRYEFPADRATLVIADNETGKSTLAAAILATLCGFPNERRSQSRMVLKERYQPWNGDAYAVEMDVCTDGKRLRIERDFAKGSFVVRDRDTGKDISAGFDPDLASQILHLPREDFQRIAFISGKEVPSFDRAETIQSRLSALAEGSTENTGAEVAISALDGARYTFETALTIPNAIRRIREQREMKRARMDTLERDLEAAGDDARQLEQATTSVEALKVALAGLDTDYQAAIETETQTNTDNMRRLESQAALKEAEAKLSEIDKRRASAKSVWLALTAGGVMLGLVSFIAFVMRLVPAVPSVAATLLGIGLAAVGAVQSSKASFLDAEERISLEGEIRHIRTASSEEQSAPVPAGARSFLIEGERRERRQALDEANDLARRLQATVGSAVDSYKREMPKLQEEMRKLDCELEKAQRFEAAITIAREALGEVAEQSHRRWAAALNDKASAILPNLNPDYADLRFDDSLAFTIRHVQDNRTLEQADIDTRLSTGAKDQVYLAVRLAFCEELSRDAESIPVLLDDPLIAADDSRFASGMRYLAETFAKEHQVLILSCSKQRHEALASELWFGGNVHQLAL